MEKCPFWKDGCNHSQWTGIDICGSCLPRLTLIRFITDGRIIEYFCFLFILIGVTRLDFDLFKYLCVYLAITDERQEQIACTWSLNNNQKKGDKMNKGLRPEDDIKAELKRLVEQKEQWDRESAEKQAQEALLSKAEIPKEEKIKTKEKHGLFQIIMGGLKGRFA